MTDSPSVLCVRSSFTDNRYLQRVRRDGHGVCPLVVEPLRQAGWGRKAGSHRALLLAAGKATT